MSGIVRVLDTTALMAYAKQADVTLAYQLAACADDDQTMITSVLCVAEAYQQADGEAAALLDILLDLPAVEITECRVGEGFQVGRVARKVGRIGLAHACCLTFAENVPLITGDADAARMVLDDDQIWELLTPAPTTPVPAP